MGQQTCLKLMVAQGVYYLNWQRYIAANSTASPLIEASTEAVSQYLSNLLSSSRKRVKQSSALLPEGIITGWGGRRRKEDVG